MGRGRKKKKDREKRIIIIYEKCFPKKAPFRLHPPIEIQCPEAVSKMEWQKTHTHTHDAHLSLFALHEFFYQCVVLLPLSAPHTASYNAARLQFRGY